MILIRISTNQLILYPLSAAKVIGKIRLYEMFIGGSIGLAGLSIREYFQKVIFKEIVSILSITVIAYLLSTFLNFNITVGVSMAVFTFIIFLY